MSGPKDKVSSTDHVEAGISTEVVAPEFPCPGCGGAMKDHGNKESMRAGKALRICSSKECRLTADWASGSAVLLNN